MESGDISTNPESKDQQDKAEKHGDEILKSMSPVLDRLENRLGSMDVGGFESKLEENLKSVENPTISSKSINPSVNNSQSTAMDPQELTEINSVLSEIIGEIVLKNPGKAVPSNVFGLIAEAFNTKISILKSSIYNSQQVLEKDRPRLKNVWDTFELGVNTEREIMAEVINDGINESIENIKKMENDLLLTEKAFQSFKEKYQMQQQKGPMTFANGQFG